MSYALKCDACGTLYDKSVTEHIDTYIHSMRFRVSVKVSRDEHGFRPHVLGRVDLCCGCLVKSVYKLMTLFGIKEEHD